MKFRQRPKTEQRSQWDKAFSHETAFFGEEPSGFAQKSLELFRGGEVHSVLELGCGQGRDTFLFACNDLQVTALDYSEVAVTAIREKAATIGLSSLVTSLHHDVGQPLPFPDASFDACYSHMLLCMELTLSEITFILGEIHRVLRPGGIVAYSVRSDYDKYYRAGACLGDDIYKIGDFAVHFFTTDKIRKMTKGYDLLGIDRLEEGSLPRDLYCVTMKKGPVGVAFTLTLARRAKWPVRWINSKYLWMPPWRPESLITKLSNWSPWGQPLPPGATPERTLASQLRGKPEQQKRKCRRWRRLPWPSTRSKPSLCSMAKLKTWWTPRRHQPMMPPSHSPEKLEERKGPLQLKWSNN
jgi:SAM-dependent methyltransferase